MKGNVDKCQLISNKINTELFIKIRDESVFNSKTAKILGITFNNNLTFELQIKTLCKTANQKVSALARISPFLNISK